jgi:hypothetical protein
LGDLDIAFDPFLSRWQVLHSYLLPSAPRKLCRMGRVIDAYRADKRAERVGIIDPPNSSGSRVRTHLADERT